MIYSFVDRSPGLHFICYQVDASLYLGRFFDIVKICILQNGNKTSFYVAKKKNYPLGTIEIA